MIVGWLEDTIDYVGGAELDADALRAATPHEIVRMAPGQVEAGCDLYVACNVILYSPGDIDRITGPLVKLVNDTWAHGPPDTRQAVLDKADLVVFRSPLHQQRFQFTYRGDTALIPSHVDLAPFRALADTPKQDRVIWLAHALGPPRHLGLKAVRKWAAGMGLDVDAYGMHTDNGPVSAHDVPALLASYRWYGHAMGRGGYEPFGRATVEAWAAGCDLAVGDQIGASWWLFEKPWALENPAGEFWAQAEELTERCLTSA